MGRRRKTEAAERRCRCCGSVLPIQCLWICEPCQSIGRGRQYKGELTDSEELLRIAQERVKCKVDPLEGMNMEEIAALSWMFRHSGYGSYGKLREYVRQTGKLPPMK